MTVADGSQTRLADVAEATIGTIPANPAWQIMRYVSASLRPQKTTDISDEIRADRNVPDIIKTGESVAGDISTRYSFGTYHNWLERLLAGAWTTNVLKNGGLHKSGALEFTYEQGATDAYIRMLGCRWNSLGLSLQARQPVRATWGIVGLKADTPATAIVTGATYVAATTTEDFNAALNVGSLAFTGIANGPKIQSMQVNISNNIYPIDVIGQYEPYAHGLGRFDLSGSFRALFENLDTYNAIINHSDVALGFTLSDAAGNAEAWSIPRVKLLDGAPVVQGNNQPVVVDVNWQAKYDSTSAASLTITRTPAA
jgi:hypothetical protein